MDATIGASAAMPVRGQLFTFRGRLGDMYKIHVVNILFTIVTLGIYRFWAKTRMRRYLWGHIEIAGDPLEYTGTGKELFLGFVVVFFVILLPVFILPTFVLPFVRHDLVWLHPAIQAAQFVVIVLLLPVAIYRARRYRLSRTRWRGVRGALSGKAFTFAVTYIATGLLQLITFGLMTPTAHNRVAHCMYNNIQAGDVPLRFTARSGPMYVKFWQAIGLLTVLAIVFMLVGWVLTTSLAASTARGDDVMPIFRATAAFGVVGALVFLIILALPLWWYGACETIYYVSETTLGDLRFALDISPWRLIAFNIVNLIILMITLTLGLPWIYKRTLDFFANCLTVTGDVNALSIGQSTDQGPRQGEGLADAFDPAGF